MGSEPISIPERRTATCRPIICNRFFRRGQKSPANVIEIYVHDTGDRHIPIILMNFASLRLSPCILSGALASPLISAIIIYRILHPDETAPDNRDVESGYLITEPLRGAARVRANRIGTLGDEF